MTLSSPTKLLTKFPSFFDASFALAGVVVNQSLGIDPTVGVLAISLVIISVVIIGRTLEKVLVKLRKTARAETVQPHIDQVVAQVFSWGAEFTVGVGVGIVLSQRTWWSLGFLVIYFGVAAAMFAIRKAFHNDENKRWSVDPVLFEHVPSTRDPSASESWFRQEDLVHFSKPWLIFEALFGGLVGFAASGLILLYVVLRYTPLIPLFVPGVIAATVFLSGVGLLRNRILRYVAARGFRTTFHFRTAAFGFYVASVVSGALGLGYGYGYVSLQSTGLVLPLAGLFLLFLYLYSLWSKILMRSEEGRLCIFQFIVEHGEDGNGYSWLKRGLNMTQSMLESFGVSTKRNGLYFGSSYSLLESSYQEWDLDNIYFLGDWTSQPNELRSVHEIASWFLHRSKKAEKRGFARVFSLRDQILDRQTLQVIIGVAGVIASIAIAVLRR